MAIGKQVYIRNLKDDHIEKLMKLSKIANKKSSTDLLLFALDGYFLLSEELDNKEESLKELKKTLKLKEEEHRAGVKEKDEIINEYNSYFQMEDSLRKMRININKRANGKK